MPLPVIGPYQTATADLPRDGHANTQKIFHFCRGRLTVYTTVVGTELSDFMRLLEQETARLGSARYSVQPVGTGPIRSLTFTWREQTWETTLGTALGTPGAHITRGWSMTPGICP